jgi:hypothetical protein
MAIKLFGFEISRTPETEPIQPAITAPVLDDGAINISAGGYFGTYLDLETSFKNENDLITRYREMAMQPELETAIDDIVNESVVHDEFGKSVSIMVDDIEQPENIKQMIRDEFTNVLRLLNFSNEGADIFRQWYIDGRLFYQVLVNQENPLEGIKDLVFIDPRKIKKVRQVLKQKDPRTGVEVVAGVQEFYVYNEKASTTGQTIVSSPVDATVKIATDAIINVNSGKLDPRKQMVLSYLHKAIKPLNNLRMVEDAVVIYRLSRAPERRVFYVDVGNMPKIKSEQYLRDMMTKFRNKVVYDSNTGEVKDDRKFLSMMEDFWIPRRGEGKATEVTTLPSGQNLGELSDVNYFKRKLYESLNVPISRLEPQTGFTLGRSNEITRDELKFNKFVENLRSKFSTLFDELMQRQLALKGICSIEEWEELREKIHYDFLKDNNFSEMKESELMANRLQLLNQVDPYVGIYFSRAWVKKNVLHFDEEGIERMDEEINLEQEQQIAQQAQMAEMGLSPDGQPMEQAQEQQSSEHPVNAKFAKLNR